jgi:hypothetical protein
LWPRLLKGGQAYTASPWHVCCRSRHAQTK